MTDNNQRRSIWDMNAQDTTFYLILFIALMLLGTAYVLWYRIGVEQIPGSERAFVFIKDLGQVGVSAAVSAFTLVVARRGVMALIDWPSKEKYRAEGRVEGRAEGRAEGREKGREEGKLEAQREWMRWNARRIEAERRGEKFDEPPPGA